MMYVRYLACRSQAMRAYRNEHSHCSLYRTNLLTMTSVITCLLRVTAALHRHVKPYCTYRMVPQIYIYKAYVSLHARCAFILQKNLELKSSYSMGSQAHPVSRGPLRKLAVGVAPRTTRESHASGCKNSLAVKQFACQMVLTSALHGQLARER